MTRYHINPETGNPGVCNPEKTGICRYGSDAPHFDSPEQAREAFEANMDTFTVMVKKSEGGSSPREVNTFDAVIAHRMSIAVQEYEDAPDKARWIEDKVVALDEAKQNLYNSAPGTAERSEALAARANAREELLAADLVMWRDSPVYNEAVEARMRDTVVNVSDADSSIESALADPAGIADVSRQYNLSTRDVENILEVAQSDYLRPRAPLSYSLNDLAMNPVYATTTAHVFRVPPEAVSGVLSFAASRSAVPRSQGVNEFGDMVF